MFLRVVETIVTQEKIANEEINYDESETDRLSDINEEELSDVHGKSLRGNS